MLISWRCVGFATVALWGLACDPSADPAKPVQEPASDAESEEFEPAPTAPTPPPSPPGATPEGDTDDGPTPLGFITEPDGGLVAFECSLYAQDCGPGEKCNVWANDGGSSWNATKCVAEDPSPDKVGESCRMLGNRLSGEDTCEKGAFCWDVDPETSEGMCVNFCMGPESLPLCDNPREQPAAGKTFCLCLPMCDPLLNDCPVGCACYPTGERFQCVPDASGDAGSFGDPCEYTNACDPGSVCIWPEHVEGCESSGCCTRYCNLGTMDTCPGEHECVPWYGEGSSPPGFEDVGVCALALE